MKKHHKNSRTKPENEKAIDTVELTQEIPEEFREIPSHELQPSSSDTSINWSQADDRSEDLINETDPFIQQPERNTQIPAELIQKRAYYLYEQRGCGPDGNLADWFEAERQLRKERNPK
jgi:hypothetical protein